MTGPLLVVNADDLGLTEGVNDGVLRAHAEGIVTSASLMVRAPHAGDAVERARAHPRLALGLHVDLGEWEPADGSWRARYEVVDTADPAAVRDEVHRQLGRFAELTGRLPTHLDSHQHVHRTEPVRSILGVLARRLGVPLRHHGRVAYRGEFYGQDSQGRTLPGAVAPEALARIIRALPPGASELCCHPAARAGADLAYGAERVAELHALCHPAARTAAGEAGVRLCTFDEARALLRRDPSR